MTELKIGPTFPQEVLAAGQDLEGFSWNMITGEFFFMPEVSPEKQSAILAVYEAHDPTKELEPEA